MNILNKKRQITANSTQQNQPKKKKKLEIVETETKKCFIQYLNPDGDKKGEVCEINSSFSIEKLNELLCAFLPEVK
jgi:hypothetical protein